METGPGLPVYQDPDQPIDRRVEDLLARMTLEEKVGQLNMPFPLPAAYMAMLGRTMPGDVEQCEQFAAGTYTHEIGPGGGFFGLANMHLPEGARQQAECYNRLQAIASQTRLQIPLLVTEEGTHGATLSGATIFPEGLAIGSTWNMDQVKAVYAAAAREARAIGVHGLCTLVVEPNRDPRLGRNCEGYGEDPYLCSRVAQSIVEGAQGDDVSSPDRAIAVLCHYPGQSQPVSGMERGAMEISERTLREVFLPPWEAGIRRAGALGVMATYAAVDGMPTHGSEKLLTQILRHELDFRGLVLSEGFGFETLLYESIVATQQEAGALALEAGLDVNITYEDAYLGPLIDAVRQGRVPMAWIDRAVRRVLESKFRLGLFERPTVDPDRAVQVVHCREHQDLALQVAREGIVLLKNEQDLLPLSDKLASIAVIGPNADDGVNQLGDYTTGRVLQPITTVLAGIRTRVAPETLVTVARGCEVLGEDRSGFDEAIAAAKQADVAIVVVGEKQGNFFVGDWTATDGERFDVASLDLTGVQEELIRAVHETGTPTVVVLINGRPLSIHWTAEHVPAIVEAWFPGERGGEAVAEVLFGDVNPSGRLPITIPHHVGQLPAYYNCKPSKAYWVAQSGYVDMPSTPLYEFGFGISYTRFEYGNLQIDPPEIAPSGTVRVSLDVTNVGRRQGREVVQLYIRDVLSSVVTPVKQLRGFEKVALQPGETQTVSLVLSPEDLCLLDREMHWVVEPGAFEVMVGASSADIRLRGEFRVVEE